MTACDDREIPATIAIAVSSETLDCELVYAIEVMDASTVLTSKDEIKLYLAFSVKQPAHCVIQAEDRLRSLASDQIRVQPETVATVQQNDHHY